MKDTSKLVLIAVREKGMALQYASERVRNDKDVVQAAVKKDPHALQFLPIYDTGKQGDEEEEEEEEENPPEESYNFLRSQKL